MRLKRVIEELRGTESRRVVCPVIIEKQRTQWNSKIKMDSRQLFDGSLLSALCPAHGEIQGEIQEAKNSIKINPDD